jgi:pSer/pThr/pTyr-binding forkhead associated (FHA) protein
MESQDIEKTVVAQAQSPEATLLGMTITCPICKTENAPNEKYCGECGFLLTSTPVEEAVMADTSSLPRLTDASGREYLLHEGGNGIGRESADVLLADPTVSRSHAKLTLEGGKCSVEDLGSSNGTYADGKRVEAGERVEVTDGAELKFGSAVLTLKVPILDETVEEGPMEEVPEEQLPEEEAVTEAVEVAEPPEPSEPDVPEVEAIDGPAPLARLVSADPPVEFPLVAGTNTIGRRGGNDIVLGDDAYVSGAHAELTADERGFWLMDLGSTNGTLLNGSRIQSNTRMALNSGDAITFGQTALRFEVPEVVPEEADAPESGGDSND